jgi:2-amino-4-hydroxy-6-hydroxymethyldihydropteridine diphosphokinase
MLPAFVTLGANIDPEHNLRWAAGLLNDQAGVFRTSAIYRSTPLGPDGEPLDQPPYLNAAVLIHVREDVSPDVFKFRVLRAIEASMGRERSADKYAARSIDLDLALFGDRIIDDPPHNITLPDPEILTRAHVALPLADLAPAFIHPITGKTLEAIAARFADTPGITRTTLDLLPRTP